MSKIWKSRFAPLAALLFAAFAAVAGCEAKGPAEQAGASIDKGVQTPKTRSILRVPRRKQGGPSTGPSSPEPDELPTLVTSAIGLRFSSPSRSRARLPGGREFWQLDSSCVLHEPEDQQVTSPSRISQSSEPSWSRSSPDNLPSVSLRSSSRSEWESSDP